MNKQRYTDDILQSTIAIVRPNQTTGKPMPITVNDIRFFPGIHNRAQVAQEWRRDMQPLNPEIMQHVVADPIKRYELEVAAGDKCRLFFAKDLHQVEAMFSEDEIIELIALTLFHPSADGAYPGKITLMKKIQCWKSFKNWFKGKRIQEYLLETAESMQQGRVSKNNLFEPYTGSRSKITF